MTELKLQSSQLENLEHLELWELGDFENLFFRNINVNGLTAEHKLG
jgi:hypothetical protein